MSKKGKHGHSKGETLRPSVPAVFVALFQGPPDGGFFAVSADRNLRDSLERSSAYGEPFSKAHLRPISALLGSMCTACAQKSMPKVPASRKGQRTLTKESISCGGDHILILYILNRSIHQAIGALHYHGYPCVLMISHICILMDS